MVDEGNQTKRRVVSFDYDGTTAIPDKTNGIQFDDDGEIVSALNPVAAELMRLHAKKGDYVVIVTARPESALGEVWKMIRDNGLPVEEVYATGWEDKSPTLKSIGAEIHYDDNPFVLQEIRWALNGAVRTHHQVEMENIMAKWRET